MGLDMQTEFWKWVQTPELRRGLLSHKTSTCGLHVHVTREGLSKMQLSKMITFVNSPDNQDLIEAVARRYAASYSRIEKKKLGSAYRSQNSRYEAINLEPRNTVEFRIFKGSLKYESIVSAIEFVNALVNYCHDQSGYGFDLTSKSFISYLSKPEIANDTKFLRNYISNRMDI
jgi:hypothetical protein